MGCPSSVPVTPAMYPATTLFHTDRLEHTTDDDDDDNDDEEESRLWVAVVVLLLFVNDTMTRKIEIILFLPQRLIFPCSDAVDSVPAFAVYRFAVSDSIRGERQKRVNTRAMGSETKTKKLFVLQRVTCIQPPMMRSFRRIYCEDVAISGENSRRFKMLCWPPAGTGIRRHLCTL